MSLVRITMLIDVDDELLTAQKDSDSPPPEDLAEWYGGDVQAAFDQGIADPVHEELELVEEVEGEGE